MKVKYSTNFIRDIKWYLKVRHDFNFDGKLERDIEYSNTGIDGIKAFFVIDSQGKYLPTKHPNIVKSLLKTKGSVNLHIKMYAEDRVSGLFPKFELIEFLNSIDSPEWVFEAIENQKEKLIKLANL
jgi:hypothetical protein